MIGKSIQLDEKTMSKIELTTPAQLPVLEDDSRLRSGVTIADLIHASSNGYAMVVRYILMAGIDPNEKDAQGRTALEVAACKEVRDILLDAGANDPAVN